MEKWVRTCCICPKRSLFLHLALRFWNHTYRAKQLPQGIRQCKPVPRAPTHHSARSGPRVLGLEPRGLQSRTIGAESREGRVPPASHGVILGQTSRSREQGPHTRDPPQATSPGPRTNPSTVWPDLLQATASRGAPAKSCDPSSGNSFPRRSHTQSCHDFPKGPWFLGACLWAQHQNSYLSEYSPKTSCWKAPLPLRSEPLC